MRDTTVYTVVWQKSAHPLVDLNFLCSVKVCLNERHLRASFAVEFDKHNLKYYADVSDVRKFRVIFHQRSVQDIFAKMNIVMLRVWCSECCVQSGLDFEAVSGV